LKRALSFPLGPSGRVSIDGRRIKEGIRPVEAGDFRD